MIIIEIQHSNNGTTAVVPPIVQSDRDTAEQAYHLALGAAAVSNVNVHSVIMVDDYGTWVKGETYYHGTPAQTEE